MAKADVAFVAAVPLILGEAYIVILWLSRPLLGQLETDLFDLVLAQHGHQELVKRGRQAGSGQGSSFKLGRLVGNPFAKFSIVSLTGAHALINRTAPYDTS
jgi:hypothetical protein